MPDRDVYWIVFATFLAAIVVALFGLARDDSGDSLLRTRYGMLLYSGFFGFGASMYYVGRSHPYSLIVVLAFWGFSLSLLLWEAFTTWEGPATGKRFLISLIPAALLIAHVSICAGDIVHTLSPRGQFERLSIRNPIFADDLASLTGFVKQHSEPGERLVISYPYGHLIAIRAGVENVYPNGSGSELLTFGQVDEVMEAIKTDRVGRLFGQLQPEVQKRLTAEGFRKIDDITVSGIPLLGTPFERWERVPEAPRALGLPRP
jgi:hypothetical protein